MAMGDGIVTLAVQKLTDFLSGEATFLLGVNDDVVFITDELKWMRSFLKDAEKKQGTDERIRLWVAEIKTIAFKTADIIDAYNKEVKGKEPSKGKLLSTSLRKCFGVAGKTNVYDIGKEIKALKERLSDISRKREVYGIGNIGNGVQEMADDASSQKQLLQDLRRTASFTDDEHFVGFDDDVKLLERQLFSSELRRSVVSIWGMGGLGKTSLARKLYNTCKREFELHAWVCVSQEWNTKDLLARIIKALKEPSYDLLILLEKMNVDDVKRYLHKLLQYNRYLVVIDDIWDEKAWECLRSALPDNQNGSRVITTTRNEFVAELPNHRTYVHKLRHLREDESWKLFCSKAFSIQSPCSEDLEKIGKEMVAKCDGLPLAIIVLSGLLSRKQSHEWLVIKQRIWKALIDKSVHISALLELSYNDLSSELKSCFLYLGIFPEDYEIRSEKLFQLWIAEDMIPQNEGLDDLEELAESYLNELNARSLIQLSKCGYNHESTCRVHDILRSLIVNKAKELDLFHIYGESLKPSLEPLSTRRIAFRSGFVRDDIMAIDDRSCSQVHTLSFINYKSILDDGDVTKLLTLIKTRFKSLRVLDIEGVKIVTAESKLKFFEVIESLVHLRYLGLFQTWIDELPKTIGNLHALQAMDVYSGTRIRLPNDVFALKQLRYLRGFLGTKSEGIIEPPPSFKELTNLHFFDCMDISSWLGNGESDENALTEFSNLRNIRVLSVWFEYASYKLSIEPLFSCRNLFKLVLRGSIKSLPMELHTSLPRLRYLYLNGAEFEQDPLPALEKLPNLLLLSLSGFRMKRLIITAMGFYQLVSLSIHDIPEDMNMLIEEGALPSLTHIDIYPMANFTLPERFKDLPW